MSAYNVAGCCFLVLLLLALSTFHEENQNQITNINKNQNRDDIMAMFMLSGSQMSSRIIPSPHSSIPSGDQKYSTFAPAVKSRHAQQQRLSPSFMAQLDVVPHSKDGPTYAGTHNSVLEELSETKKLVGQLYANEISRDIVQVSYNEAIDILWGWSTDYVTHILDESSLVKKHGKLILDDLFNTWLHETEAALYVLKQLSASSDDEGIFVWLNNDGDEIYMAIGRNEADMYHMHAMVTSAYQYVSNRVEEALRHENKFVRLDEDYYTAPLDFIEALDLYLVNRKQTLEYGDLKKFELGRMYNSILDEVAFNHDWKKKSEAHQQNGVASASNKQILKEFGSFYKDLKARRRRSIRN